MASCLTPSSLHLRQALQGRGNHVIVARPWAMQIAALVPHFVNVWPFVSENLQTRPGLTTCLAGQQRSWRRTTPLFSRLLSSTKLGTLQFPPGAGGSGYLDISCDGAENNDNTAQARRVPDGTQHFTLVRKPVPKLGAATSFDVVICKRCDRNAASRRWTQVSHGNLPVQLGLELQNVRPCEAPPAKRVCTTVTYSVPKLHSTTEVGVVFNETWYFVRASRGRGGGKPGASLVTKAGGMHGRAHTYPQAIAISRSVFNRSPNGNPFCDRMLSFANDGMLQSPPGPGRGDLLGSRTG